MRSKSFTVLAVLVMAFLLATNPVVAGAAKLITGADIKDGSITGKDVKKKSLLAKNFKPGQLPAGPRGAQGARGQSALDPIPSGQTVTGSFSTGFMSGPGGGTAFLHVALPGRATADLFSQQVNFAPGAALPVSSDADPTCTGSVAVPTAPSGRVCIYLDGRSSGITGVVGAEFSAVPAYSRTGFDIGASTTVEAAEDLYGTWAYTAP